ncbi:hypothetical protein BDK51DRAFT_51974 [Blyttiomyces helicus]|uniref:Uncharacterized protein n=1 Tax=Blyttiomyces helicus TaxID=388810 RepID=A0A4P9WN16_9FUNG|nr:hypothetical protein BDK51DRAFT_51974 [Blyttiomyces helicus]|eukprot:RKO93892.1 hypothetical protein BDK51DRAFT_51974 [Blyttiomyces helicus]
MASVNSDDRRTLDEARGSRENTRTNWKHAGDGWEPPRRVTCDGRVAFTSSQVESDSDLPPFSHALVSLAESPVEPWYLDAWVPWYHLHGGPPRLPPAIKYAIGGAAFPHLPHSSTKPTPTPFGPAAKLPPLTSTSINPLTTLCDQRTRRPQPRSSLSIAAATCPNSLRNCQRLARSHRLQGQEDLRPLTSWFSAQSFRGLFPQTSGAPSRGDWEGGHQDGTPGCWVMGGGINVEEEEQLDKADKESKDIGLLPAAKCCEWKGLRPNVPWILNFAVFKGVRPIPASTPEVFSRLIKEWNDFKSLALCLVQHPSLQFLLEMLKREVVIPTSTFIWDDLRRMHAELGGRYR